jgi:hypothetical protein
LKVRVYAVGATGYKESATAAVAAFGPTVTAALNAASGASDWTNATVGLADADNPVIWYSFVATGGIYNVKWDDRFNGSGTYASNGADIVVTAYGDDGSELFAVTGTAYSTPQTISGYTGTVYLKVTPYDPYYGHFAIMFHK